MYQCEDCESKYETEAEMKSCERAHAEADWEIEKIQRTLRYGRCPDCSVGLIMLDGHHYCWECQKRVYRHPMKQLTDRIYYELRTKPQLQKMAASASEPTEKGSQIAEGE